LIHYDHENQIFLFCALVLGFCVYLLMHRPIKQEAVESFHTNLVSSALAVAQGQTAKGVNNATASTPPITGAPISMPPHDRSVEVSNYNQQLLTEWQAPINFYGKVVDESNNPVSGAGVQFGWSETPRDYAGHTSTTTSDTAGLFELHGVHGPSLEVSVGKQGYDTSHRDTTAFTYAISGHFSPDPFNPVVFHLRKKREGTDLITVDYPGFAHIAQLRHDGTPIDLDLFSGQKVSAGNGTLHLTLERELVAKNVRKYNWRLGISVPNGGIMETYEEFPFEAPQNGYQPDIVVDMPSTSANWHEEMRAKYYILLPNGNYGRIDFYLLAYNGVFTVQSAINPNGSQNLEPAN
jgi:hypothetical protein